MSNVMPQAPDLASAKAHAVHTSGAPATGAPAKVWVAGAWNVACFGHAVQRSIQLAASQRSGGFFHVPRLSTAQTSLRLAAFLCILADHGHHSTSPLRFKPVA
jgi:hypothetical protein